MCKSFFCGSSIALIFTILDKMYVRYNSNSYSWANNNLLNDYIQCPNSRIHIMICCRLPYRLEVSSVDFFHCFNVLYDKTIYPTASNLSPLKLSKKLNILRLLNLGAVKLILSSIFILQDYFTSVG